MKFILFFLLLTYSVACSGETEKGQSPEKNIKAIENPPINSLEPQTNIIQEHISGSGETHISGGSSSFHISGQ